MSGDPPPPPPEPAEKVVWVAPDKRFTKTIVTKGFGFYTPQDGSVCKIKVIKDESKVLSDVNDEQEKELIVSDVDCPIDRVLEACVRTMKLEEICIMTFPDPSRPLPAIKKSNSSDGNNPVTTPEDEPKSSVVEKDLEQFEVSDDASLPAKDASEYPDIVPDTPQDNHEPIDICDKEQDSNSNNPATSISDEPPDSEKSPVDSEKSENFDFSPTMFEVQIQLLSYTREPEIWEMSITEKWRRANYHKQKGMELYSRGQFEWAFRRFSLSLKYLISLEHDIPSGQEEGMNISGMKLSCYLNLAACQMRHHNYEFVVKNCTKALEIQENNSKALYRRGAALLQLQEYEKAKEDLDRAHELEPKNQAIISQQQLLKAKVQKLNQYYANAMKKLFM